MSEGLYDPDATAHDTGRGSAADDPSSGSDSGRLGAPRTHIGRFEIVSELGRGGMGRVYRARHPTMSREVAVKTMFGGWMVDPEARDRFIREAQLCARLSHPHIVCVYEAGFDGDRPFIAMEHVEGESLEELLGRGAVSEMQVCGIAVQIARALHHAHRAGVVHRDVKPQNILVDRAGDARLTDFGLARDGGSRITVTGDVIGTPDYMAPEQVAAQRGREGPATDVWAVGAVLYRALLGRAPFEGAGTVDTFVRVQTIEPVAPRRRRPELAPELEAIILRCLSKRPEDRFASAAELADALERVASDPCPGAGAAASAPAGRRAWAVPAAVAFAVALALGLVALVAVPAIARSRRRAEVSRALELARDPAAREQAVALLADGGDEETVTRLAEKLDAISEEMRAATLALFATGRVPTPREGGLGATEIDGIETALDAWLDLDRADETRGGGQTRALARASRRLEARAALRVPVERRRDVHWSEMLAAAQARAVGDRIHVATACCDALGRIGIAPGAVDPLARYVAVEADPGRAAVAGLALCRLDDPRARHALAMSIIHHGEDRPYAARVAALVAAAGLVLPEASGALARLDRDYMKRHRQGDVEGGLALLDRMIAAQPDGAESFIARGGLKKTINRLDEALADLDRALALDPEHYDALAYRAQTRLLRGDVAGAREDAERAVGLGPQAVIGWIFYAEILFAAGEPAQATAAAEQAVLLGPDEAEAWLTRSSIRARSGDLDGALDDAKQAARLEPNNASVHMHLGQLHAGGGRFQSALEAFSRSIELDPRFDRGWQQRGRLREAMGDLEGALADMSKAIELMPTDPELWVSRALLRQRTDLRGALADADHAVGLEPPSARAFYVRGRLRQQAGVLEAALEDLTRAIELAPGPWQHWSSRAAVHHQLGEDAKAIADYERALRCDGVPADQAGRMSSAIRLIRGR